MLDLVAQSCPTLRDPMDCSLQDPLSMGFSRQEHWSVVMRRASIRHRSGWFF